MRHRKQGRKFNRTNSHRKAMFRNMVSSLILCESIKTTLPKAKELRTFIEPLITLAKKEYKLRNDLDIQSNEFKAQSVGLRRQVFKFSRSKSTVKKLFEELGTRYAERSGGYTRVRKYGYRFGDKAPMALIELMDKPQDEQSTDEE